MKTAVTALCVLAASYLLFAAGVSFGRQLESTRGDLNFGRFYACEDQRLRGQL